MLVHINNADEIKNIITKFENNHYIVKILDGRKIQNAEQYIRAIYEGFEKWGVIKLNTPNAKTDYQSYFNVITDLSWSTENKRVKGFVLIIDFYPAFLEQEPTFKNFMNKKGFLDITNFWENNLKTGKTIPFDIYLVDRIIENQILHINPDEINNILTQAKDNNYYIVTLDGRNIHNQQDYLILAYEKFQFNVENPRYIYNAYNDWITDLGWLIDDGYKGFGLIIDYYHSFLDHDPYFKKFMNKEGFNDITSFWDHDVLKYVSGGEVMPFNIYLVDR